MKKRLRCAISVGLALALALVSCAEPGLTGALDVVVPGGNAKSILPGNTAITWIKISGSRNDDTDVNIAEQSFKLGDPIRISGLSVGTWTFNVTGYNDDPANGGVLLTQVATDNDVVIQSGKTTTATFVLHYLATGSGTATVTVNWPTSTSVSMTGSLSSGEKTVSPGTVTSGSGTATLSFSGVDVGDYDLALTATNLSGKTINFPMIDMVNVFGSLSSTGSVTLESADFVSAPLPTFAPSATTYTNTTASPAYAYRTVSISSSTSGAEYYYTTDGTTPGFSSTGKLSGTTKKYASPFEITATNETKSTTVKAIAVCNGYVDSSAATETFSVNGQGTGGMTITDPSLISNVVITQDSTNKRKFTVSYTTQGTPKEAITWYADTKATAATDTDSDNNSKTITFGTAALSSGRHQIMVSISYTDGDTKKTAFASLRCTI